MAAERERYSIIKRLDKGGMAEVFLGRSTSLEGFDKVVAIKRVLPDLALNDRFVNMFLDEAKLSLHLDHANIVSVFDVGRSGQSYFIVMEFIDGTNMKRLIEGRAMPLDLACYVAIEVCKGLVYAHEKLDGKGQPLQIVHRDISPPNILISREGEVKLTDFGLARAASQIETTDPGVVKGKFAYLSPEASMGEDVDLRADIFAAGIVLWESLAGRRLFQGATDLETLENVRACKVPSIHRVRTDIPAALDRILHRALAKNPADRYSSAREFGRELSQFLVEQRLSVTSYDLAAWIQELIDLPPDVSRLSPSLAESAVQDELERFIGLEDESVVMPAVARSGRNTSASSFEDPRLWGVIDDAGGEAISDRLENAPSGVWDLRSGTQKLGRPLTDSEVLTGSIPRAGLGLPPPTGRPNIPRPATTKTKTLPPGAVVPTKGSGARRLPPPPTSSGPPSSLPPVTRPAGERVRPPRPQAPPPRASHTMMMTPLDAQFFDSIDADPADAVERVEAPALPTAKHEVQHTPAPRTLPASRAVETPAPSPIIEHQEPDEDVSTMMISPGAFLTEPTPPLAESRQTAVGMPAANAATQPMPAALAEEEAARKARDVATTKPVGHAAVSETSKPARGTAVVAKKGSSPWLAQLITLLAFGAIVYVSYLIFAPVLG